MTPAYYVLFFFVGCVCISVECLLLRKRALPLCGGSIKTGCIEREALTQDVCINESANITTVVRLPQDITKKINLESLGLVRHRDDKLIQGYEKNFRYNAADRWSLGFSIDEGESENGLLTLRVSVKNLQEEDMFKSHFEINNAESDEILLTTHMNWFNVSGSCPPPTRPNEDKTYYYKQDELKTLITEVLNCSKKTLDVCASMKNERPIFEAELRDICDPKLYYLLLASVIIYFVTCICQFCLYIVRKWSRKKGDGASENSSDSALRRESGLVNPTDEAEENARRCPQRTSASINIDSQAGTVWYTPRDQGRDEEDKDGEDSLFLGNRDNR